MPHVMISRKKCTGCHMCELACSAYHEGAYRPSVARLYSECNPTTTEIKGHTCLQTGCAKCQQACPNDAIVTKQITVTPKGFFESKEKVGDSVEGFVLVVDEEKCTNCGECYEVCPTGVIHEHPDREVAFKCDLCDGEPQCIAFCQNKYVYAVDLKVDKKDKALVAAAGTAGA
jgi:anaerobic carbon-monoxide dehydrogenase iron sulfur subunit